MLFVKIACLESHHFEVWSAPASCLFGLRRILSQIVGMHSKTGIETWPRVVLGTYRKVRSQGYSRYMPMQTLLHQKKIP